MPAVIVNLFGGPCTGKSTVAAGVFFELKKKRIQSEFVNEFAKDLTWEKRHKALTNQMYITGKQVQRIERCTDEVEVIVMDTSILLSAVYMPNNYPDSFADTVYEIYKNMDNMAYNLERSFPYDPVGRGQTEQEARDVDPKVTHWLETWRVPYTNLRGRHPDSASDEAVHHIVGDVLSRVR